LALVAGGKSNDILAGFKHLSPQKILDSANYYHERSSFDTALILYSSIINTVVEDTDFEQQKRIIEAYNRSARIYRDLSDFRTANIYFLEALHLCEKYNYTSYKSRIYLNIGIIFFDFKEYDIAESYFLRALELSHQDSLINQVVFNNLGAIQMRLGNMDSAFFFLNKSLQISVHQLDNTNLHYVLNLFALCHQEIKQYDSALYYFRLALNDAKKKNRIDKYAYYLSFVGKLFVETGNIDSALYYINQSNTIAENRNLLSILVENYLVLSQIQSSKNNKTKAFEYFQKHTALKDSIFNAGVLGNINQLQHLHEVSKTNRQIEQLHYEQQVKERTIYYQKIIQHIILAVLLSVIGILIYVSLQKRKLNTAYNVLFEKNVEIIGLQNHSSEKDLEKYRKSALKDDKHDELLNKILVIMEDTSIICDTEFSIDKLAELLYSNQTYVSQVINSALKKNFRSFLNGYRIQEAQRLFLEPETVKYTIETVALKVGFKSRNAFTLAFKEITGVSPNFYIKSISR
jgi:AraC-like DNA-binding protein/Tfp pilus assembly protein PilF